MFTGMQAHIRILFLATAAAILTSCAPFRAQFAVSTFSSVDQITPSTIGRLDPIVVRFKDPIAKPENLVGAVRLSSAPSGNWESLDERTIRFTPTMPYAGGKSFRLTVDTGVLRGAKAGESGFTADFTARDPSFEVVPDGLYADGAGSSFTFTGNLVTDIPVSTDAAKKALMAKLSPQGSAQAPGTSRALPIEWDESGLADAHRFTVRNIARQDAAQYLRVTVDASALSAQGDWEKTWIVPQADEFSVLEIAATDPSCVEVRFSDAIDDKQDLRGFVTSPAQAVNVRFSVDRNVVRLYNADGWGGDGNITVREGIKSAEGKILAKGASALTRADWELPAVKFADDGVILPTSSGVTVPVKTKNLRGLIVEAYVIYGDNILQYLQENELDEQYQLNRVGEPVWSDAFDFSWDDSMKNRWVARGLDLTELVKKYPGGMFNLRVTFRKRHVMYECRADHQDFSDLPMPSDEITLDKKNEYSYWDEYRPDYKIRRTYWQYRDDPCHPAYYLPDYNEDVLIHKNVLVSNLGVMAKLDAEGTWHVAVSDLVSTDPVRDADVVLYSYAQKELSRTKTDERGMTTIKPAREAYFMTASRDGQTSYLRIDSGMALSVSHFAVDGEKPDKGVKGFIYGERGVWRPGDDIHLTFVLQDLQKKLPASFPITFELEDPQGRLTKSAVIADSVDGFYRIDTGTNANAPTGSWVARVKAGGQTWTMRLRIEAIVPNRLSIDLTTPKSYLVARSNAFTLKGAWLHGAKAAGLKADVSVIFYPGTTSFADYPDYVFTDPDRSVESERQTVWEGALDGDSTAKFNLDLSAGENLPGKLRAQLETRIFEPSGMFSVQQVRYDYSPYDRYVGIKAPKGDAARGMLVTGTKHRVDIALVDPEGKPIAQSVPVSVSLYKLEWRWWWEKDALTDATYVSGQSANRIATGTVTVKKGRGTWDFQVDYPEWGRYLIVAEDGTGGHRAAKVVYIDWPGWAGRGQEAGTGSAAMLTLSKDKDAYKTGETAVITFPSGSNARALVTVEKDGMIVRQDWMETTNGTSVYRLPLTGDMAPNVYVHVTLLQKHLQTANDLPIRLYGVIPIMVEDPNTRLHPEIASSDTFEPKKTARLTVKERDGRPMTYTIAIVDEGLLGLTRFTAADPWTEFYKKEASRLPSWDIYRYVMSAFGGKLETILSIGGSEELLNGGKKDAERFKPVVKVFGPYRLAANETGNVEFEMPQYVGAVRAMVVAGKDGAYGVAERTVPVKADLMVQPTLPRTLGVRESIDVPITVFNGKDADRVVAFTLESDELIPHRQTIKARVPANGEKTLTMSLSTDRACTAHVAASAVPDDATGTKAETSVEIGVFSRGTPNVAAEKFIVKPGETYRGFADSPGENGTKTMSVELGTLPVLDIQSRMEYLIAYPHGCIEQITSGAFPQLYLRDLTETTPAQNETIKKNVISALSRLADYQTTTGGFAYWTGGKNESFWGTNYAGHFMVEAKKAGYAVESATYDSWLAFQKKAAQSWLKTGDNDETSQAYRLYTLALAGDADIGSMNRLSVETGMPNAARWFLADAYALAGHRQTAVNLTARLPLQTEEYRETGNTFGSNNRDDAVILRMLTDLGDTRKADEIVPKLVERFSSDSWYSTQETSWMILALAPYYRDADAKRAAWTLETDREKLSGDIASKAITRELSTTDGNRQPFAVANDGSKTLYGKIVTRGMLPAGTEAPIERGLSLDVTYYDASGDQISPENIAFGDSFSMRVSVRNSGSRGIQNIALTVPVPTCWEFGNARVGSDDETDASEANDGYEDDDEEETIKPSSANERQDFRDDRIVSYFDLGFDESKTFEFYATAAYNGTYIVPAIHAEAMYDETIQAIVPGRTVAKTVIDPRSNARSSGR